MQIYTLMSRFLDYPNEELIEALDDVIEELPKDKNIGAEERDAIMQFISWVRLHDLTALQGIYVQTFDMTPEHDLHLTHHLFGDDRGRGPALIDLSEHYKEAGLQMAEGEIPDYLPLILEYVSTLEELQARVFLGDAAKVVKVLAENLEKKASPYARLLRIVENRGHLARAA